MNRLNIPKTVLGAVLASWLLGGCSLYQPYEYHDDREEMQGPGLFSGEDGVFTIIGKKNPEEGKQAADKTGASEDRDQKDRRETQ